MTNQTASHQGTLYGVGVGPGDPKLVTLKALEIIKSAPVVFAASSPKNNYSHALDVVKEHLDETTEIIMLPFPMTEKPTDLNTAWRENALKVLDVLNSGRDAAFITIGDPMTYSTFCYLMKTIYEIDGGVNVATIPGVTSYQAAAARLNVPLAMGREPLMIIPGISERERIEELAASSENLVIMKAYRNYEDIARALEKHGLEKKAVLVSRCGHKDETIEWGARVERDDVPPYLSLMIVKRSGLV